jgi:hypothetical protein
MKDRRPDPGERSIASTAREEARDALADPRWESLSAGTASAEDRAELEALAASAPEAEGAMDLFAPLGAEAEARFAEAIEARMKADQRAGSNGAKVAPAAPAPAEAPIANVVPLRADRRPRWARWTAAASALAIAAAIALGISLRPKGSAEGDLPEFSPIFVSGVKEHRGDDPEPVRIRPDTTIVAALRPATPVAGAVAASAWIVRGAEAIALPSQIETSSDGAVRLSASLPAGRRVAPGPADLLIAVCRPGSLPAADPPPIAALGRSGDRCRSIHHAITVEAP